MGRIAIVVGFQITSSDWDREAWRQFYYRIKVNIICLVLIFFSLVGFYFIDIVREVYKFYHPNGPSGTPPVQLLWTYGAPAVQLLYIYGAPPVQLLWMFRVSSVPLLWT